MTHTVFSAICYTITRVLEIVVNDELVTECSRIATCFNEFFEPVFTDISANNFSPFALQSPYISTLPEIKFSYEGIVALLPNIKHMKPIGPDGIPKAFLRSIQNG